ncbi:MAG: hypothetical protein ACYTFF_16485, partial [Planctomycetota bacterium]
MACIIALLPSVSRVMRSESRMGIPDETRVPSVRVNRATATSRSRRPTSGARSLTRSTRSRLTGRATHIPQPIHAAT